MAKNKLKFAFLAVIVLIFTFLSEMNTVQAMSSGGGTGGGNASGSAAGWVHAHGDPWDGKGTTDAFKAFFKADKKRASKPGSFNTEQRVNSLGKVGNFDGTLYDACKKSQYIWWYGSGNYWNSVIGSNAHPKPSNMPTSTEASVNSLNGYMNLPNHKWGQSGGTVLICSWGLEGNQEGTLTFVANSGSFTYDGNPKTVTGWESIGGGLFEGDEYIQDNSIARGTRTETGYYKGAVKFTDEVTIMRGDKIVNDEYTINYINGDITITENSTVPGDRCVPTGSDYVDGIVQNDVTIHHAFAPNDSGSFGTIGPVERFNDAFHLTQNLPKGGGLSGDTKSRWNSWKSGFLVGAQDEETKEVDIGGLVKGTLMKYGGVIDVTRTHYFSEVDVTFCQPQERRTGSYTDSEGNTVTYTYYVNVGPERIDTISLNDRYRDRHHSYQILGVNCNVEGFNQVKQDFDTVDFSLGDGTGSGLLQTVEQEGKHYPLGTGYTGSNDFYTPGKDSQWTNSCRETFKDICTNEILESGVENDADNNRMEEPLFTHEDEAGEHHIPSEAEGELNIFRDNNDRQVRADVWYPKETGKVDLITYPGEAAKRTTGKIFSGTPEMEITTIAPWDENKAGTNSKMNDDKIEEQEIDWYWDEHINRFTMRSEWSSKKGKPYELGVDWVYESEAENVGPNVVDGYEILSVTDKETYVFESHCVFQNENGLYDAEIPYDPFNTPGEINDSEEYPIWEDAGLIKSLFTRSVSDRGVN